METVIVARRGHHYDQAFEHYLRSNRIAYISVDEAHRALHGADRLKNFDFVVYGENGPNLLVDVKGRKHNGRSRRQLDNWVTERDVTDLLKWEQVFGAGFRGTLVFLYWCAAQPPDALFHEIFCFNDRWYAMLGMEISAYRQHMTVRSSRWRTVHIPAGVFGRQARPWGKCFIRREPHERVVRLKHKAAWMGQSDRRRPSRDWGATTMNGFSLHCEPDGLGLCHADSAESQR